MLPVCSGLLKGEAVLQALLLFVLLLTGALAGHEKVGPGTDPDGQKAAPISDVRGGTDPDGLQAAGPTSDLIGGLDPNGSK
jgi:hypothetical protein